MHILLPPSETKSRPASGAPLRLEDLAFPALQRARATMLAAAIRTAESGGAAEALKVPASSPELVERMQTIAEEPTAPALAVYSGVLYDALGGARPREDRRVLVTSALFGLVDAATDAIPAYRLSAGSTVSRLGTVGPWWRKHLGPVGKTIAADGGVVLDCRSGAYRTMMPVPGALTVDAVREVAGRRQVISHDAKRYRGLLAKALLEADATAATAQEVRDIAEFALPNGLTVELGATGLTIVDRSER